MKAEVMNSSRRSEEAFKEEVTFELGLRGCKFAEWMELGEKAIKALKKKNIKHLLLPRVRCQSCYCGKTNKQT